MAQQGEFFDKQHTQRLADAMPVMMWLSGLDKQCTWLNARALEFLGHTGAEPTERGWIDHVHPDDMERCLARYHYAFDARQEFSLEYRLRHHDGQYRWVLDAGAPRYDTAGNFSGYAGTCIDITERKRAEQSLRAGEERYRSIVEGQAELVCQFRMDGTILFVNRAYAQSRGTTPDALVGANFWSFVDEQDRPVVRERLGQLCPESPEVRIENRFLTPAGTRWTLWTNRGLLFDAAGVPVEVQSTGIDITGRKRLEHSLRFLAEASKLLSSLVDYRNTLQQVAQLAVPDFADLCTVDMLDEGGKLQRLALAHGGGVKSRMIVDYCEQLAPDHDGPPWMTKVLRSGEAEMVAHLRSDSPMSHDAGDEHLRLLHRLLHSLGIKSYICVPMKTKSTTFGVMTFAHADSGRLYGDDDQAMIEDLAHRAAIAIENARLYQSVQEADRRKDEFLAMLAHELRNPMAPIRTGLEILDMDNSVHASTIKLMRDQVQHLVRLVDDLLDVSRIMRGRIELRHERTKLADLIERSLTAVRAQSGSAHPSIEVVIPPEPIWLDADPVRLVQVFENLLNNACKYTDAGGRIKIQGELELGHAVVRVQDSGIGIDPELLPRVFELFTQADRSLDRARGGLGIGLTLARRLVELHGGTISAHSEGLGHGSTFVVRLPTAAGAPATIEPPVAPANTRRRRVLVVDDNLAAARMLSVLLTKLGDHHVEVAHDGPSALQSIRQTAPDIVLLDIGLPGMDGYAVARAVREDQQLNHILLIALTGYGHEEARQKSREAGFDMHLVKPLEASVLQQMLADLQTRRR